MCNWLLISLNNHLIGQKQKCVSQLCYKWNIVDTVNGCFIRLFNHIWPFYEDLGEQSLSLYKTEITQLIRWISAYIHTKKKHNRNSFTKAGQDVLVFGNVDIFITYVNIQTKIINIVIQIKSFRNGKKNHIKMILHSVGLAKTKLSLNPVETWDKFCYPIINNYI